MSAARGDDKRVLVVSYSFPPYAESQSIRIAYLVEGLLRAGCAVTVVTAKHPTPLTDPELETLLSPAVRVVRTSAAPFDAVLARWPHGILPGVRWFVVNVSYRLLMPDERIGWDVVCQPELTRTFHEFKPTHILSSAGSPTAHLAVHRLLKTEGERNTIWICDYGDPWGLLPGSGSWGRMRRAMDRRMEAKILATADGVLFTTEETRQLYERNYPRLAARTHVVPYGYNPSVFPATERDGGSAALRIAHVGSSHQSTRNLIPLIRACDTLTRTGRHVELSVLGPHSVSYDRLARDLGLQYRQSQRVGFRAGLEVMASADVCVIVGNDRPEQMPGKVFHALAIGNRVLYLTQLPPHADRVAQLLDGLPQVDVVPNEAGKILDALAQARDRGARAEAMGRLQLPPLRGADVTSLGQSALGFFSRLPASD